MTDESSRVRETDQQPESVFPLVRQLTERRSASLMAPGWELHGLSWKKFSKRVWNEIIEDDVFGRAAQLSYYFLLALFPLLLFLTAVLGYFTRTASELRRQLLDYLGAMAPPAASDLINATVNEISQATGGSIVSFGLIAALWAASNGMGAISASLNIAYDVKESRPWWKERLVAIVLTIALAFLIISALALVLYGGEIAELIADRLRLGEAFVFAWNILQWPIVLGFALFAFALIYHFAPNLPKRRWQWLTLGSIVAVFLWLLVSFAFRLYLIFFDSYSKTYGSLGAVIVLMLWFYFSGAAILIGGEINSEIEHAQAQVSSSTQKP